MKKIPLTRGYVAIVDDCDYDYLMQWKWYAHDSSVGRVYAMRTARLSENLPHRSSKVTMHSMVLTRAGIPFAGKSIDHKNGDSLLNIRENLRPATQSQNTANRCKFSNSTGFLGVSKNGAAPRWRARIMREGKMIQLGSYGSPEAAAEAYNKAAIENFGEFARLNTIPSIAQQSAA